MYPLRQGGYQRDMGRDYRQFAGGQPAPTFGETAPSQVSRPSPFNKTQGAGAVPPAATGYAPRNMTVNGPMLAQALRRF